MEPSGKQPGPATTVQGWRRSALVLASAGAVAVATSPWWAAPLREALVALPGGRWIALAIPFMPLLVIALAARLATFPRLEI